MSKPKIVLEPADRAAYMRYFRLRCLGIAGIVAPPCVLFLIGALCSGYDYPGYQLHTRMETFCKGLGSAVRALVLASVFTAVGIGICIYAVSKERDVIRRSKSKSL